MGINWAGLGAAYEGANANMDNQAQQDRLAAAEQRAEQDQDFVEFQRNIVRTNREKNLADAADIKAKYDAQAQSQAQDQQSTNSGSSDQNNQGATPAPLFKVGGLKTSVPVNVVSPQSATDDSGQGAQPAQAAQSTSSASQASQADGTPAQPAQSTDPATQTQNWGGTPAIPVAVPDPRSPTPAQAPSDASAQAGGNGDQSAPPSKASGTPNATAIPASNAGAQGTALPEATAASAPTGAPMLAASGALTNASQAAANANSQVVGSQPLIAQQSGMPQSRNFNTTLDQQLELLNRQSTDGRITPQEYVAAVKNINMLRQEGVHDAIDLMAQGQYQEAMDRFNSVGSYRDARFVKAQDGTTLVNGVSQPTKFVTLAGRNGPITIDTTQAQYQLMSADQRMALADKAAQTKMMDEHYQRDDQVHLIQANTMEGYRKDQAENFRQQRILEQEKIEAMHAQQAPIWDDKARARLDKLYTQPDPTTGVPTYDPTGAIFAKQVGLLKARSNGGDIEGALDYAYQTDLTLRKNVGNDPDKLAQARAGFLQSIVPKAATADAATPSPTPNPAQPVPDDTQLSTLSGYDPGTPNHVGIKGMLSRNDAATLDAKNPGLLAQFDRQVAYDYGQRTPNQQANAVQTPAAPAPILTTRGGMSIAERDQKVALMNQLSGGPELARRKSMIQAANDDLTQNFASRLATVKRTASRAEMGATLQWFDDHANYMSNMQKKQLREARLAAGW